MYINVYILSHYSVHATSYYYSGLTTKGEPYKLTHEVRFGHDDIIPYYQQVSTLTSHGFALWDVIQSCQREGSLDADIKHEEPNDIRGFCQAHPTIQRIVLANGSTGSSLFNKHFKDWWKSGELVPANDEFSQRAFGSKYKQAQKLLAKQKAAVKESNDVDATRTITCVCVIGVSPAAAKFSYKEKRDFWEQHVYQPGLRDYRESSVVKRESE